MALFDALWSDEKLQEKIDSMQDEVQSLDLEHKELNANLASKETMLSTGMVPHSEKRAHMNAIDATLKQMELLLLRKKQKEARIKEMQDKIDSRNSDF